MDTTTLRDGSLEQQQLPEQQQQQRRRESVRGSTVRDLTSKVELKSGMMLLELSNGDILICLESSIEVWRLAPMLQSRSRTEERQKQERQEHPQVVVKFSTVRHVRCIDQLDKHTIATCENDLMIWCIDPGPIPRKKRRLAVLNEHRNDVSCVVRLRNKRFATGSPDQTIKIWSRLRSAIVDDRLIRNDDEPPSYEFKCLHTLKGHYFGPLRALCIMPRGCNDDDLLVSGADDRTMKVWDMKTMQCIRTMKYHTNTATVEAIEVKQLVPIDQQLVCLLGRTVKDAQVWNIRLGLQLCVITNCITLSLMPGNQLTSLSRYYEPTDKEETNPLVEVKFWEVSEDLTKAKLCNSRSLTILAERCNSIVSHTKFRHKRGLIVVVSNVHTVKFERIWSKSVLEQLHRYHVLTKLLHNQVFEPRSSVLPPNCDLFKDERSTEGFDQRCPTRGVARTDSRMPVIHEGVELD